MLSILESTSVLGLDNQKINIEVDISKRGLPGFRIVGLPYKYVVESRERIRAAIRNSGFHFPGAKITVNLSPADLPKMSSILDLPIALGILVSSEQLHMKYIDKRLFVGELSLDGRVVRAQNVHSVLAFAHGRMYSHTYIPEDNADDVVESDTRIVLVRSLQHVVSLISGRTEN